MDGQRTGRLDDNTGMLEVLLCATIIGLAGLSFLGLYGLVKLVDWKNNQAGTR